MTREPREFVVPTCKVCGHPTGDHRCGGGGLLAPRRFGVCLRDGCDCKQYEEKRA